MGSYKDTGGGHFEITYGGRESPFAGLDSSAKAPTEIRPNAFFSILNCMINQNTVDATTWAQKVPASYTGSFIGFGDLLGQFFTISWTGTILTPTIVIATIPNFPFLTATQIVASIELPNGLEYTPVFGSLTFKNVNGVCYFSFPGCPYILQHNNKSGSILTSYLGTAYLNELNGRLVAGDVFQNIIPPLNATSTRQNPTTTTGTASATQTGVGTNTGSTTISGFSSLAITSQSVALNIAYNTTIPASIGNNASNVHIQYSVNSGSTFTDLIVETASDPGSITQLNIPTAGLANLNALFLRIQANAVVSTGPGSITVTVNVTNWFAVVDTSGTNNSQSVQEFPYQYAWSAPGGAYSQFNPLVNGLVTGAGFNNLPDVEDTITGIFNVGPTGYIIRAQGITEVSPLNSGIQPFDFNHLWASHKGIGTVYPGSLSQYGSIGTFFDDTDIYTIGYDGINTIGNHALAIIYQDLVINLAATSISATMSNIVINGEPALHYIVGALDTVNGFAHIYFYNFKTKEWVFHRISGSLIGGTLKGISLISINQFLSSTNGINNCVLVLGNSIPEAFFFTFPLNSFTQQNVNIPYSFILPAEELAFLRDITIDGIGLFISATDVSMTLSITGLASTNDNNQIIQTVTYQTQVIGNIGTFQYYKAFPTNGIPFTGVAPQLSVSISATDPAASYCQIAKIVLFGTIFKEQRPM